MDSFSNRGIAVVEELAADGIILSTPDNDNWTPEGVAFLRRIVLRKESDLHDLREQLRAAEAALAQGN